MHTLRNHLPGGVAPLFEAHYFPCLAFFAALWPHTAATLEACEHYSRKSYRNRCEVLTANKVVTLSVPVKHVPGKQLVRDVQIDYRENWQKDHWRTLVSGYGRAPYFTEFGSFIEVVLAKRHRFLLDLNIDSLTSCLHLLGWNKSLTVSEQYLEASFTPHDYRGLLHPKHPGLLPALYRPAGYRQCFREEFVPNLSVLDVLFCEGPYATRIIARSAAAAEKTGPATGMSQNRTPGGGS